LSAATPQLFISYRREETAGHAGRLYDAMAARFGEAHVFVDVDLAPGIDFVQRIKEAIGACHVLLVIMGPRWAEVTDPDGRPRLTDPEDFVRLEVETALRRDEVTVIPVLVGGARMPDPDDLPEGLRPLSRRNALELSDMRWRYDVGRLNATLDQLLAATTAVHAIPEPSPAAPGSADVQPAASPPAAQPNVAQPVARLPSTARLFIDGMLIAGLAALVARWIADPIDPTEATTEAGEIATAILRRTVTWAVLGAALAAWLSFIRGESGRIVARVLLGLAVGALAGAIGGAMVALPQYLSEPEISNETIRAISIGGFAVSGALIGALLGYLWVPSSVAAGLLAGLFTGALVRLVWNAVDWTPDSAFEEAFGIGIQCLLIVGLTLVALQVLSGQRKPATA
jgi:hypothetical protein